LNATLFDLVYQDEALLLANKPAGLLAVPGRGADKQDCLSARVQLEFPDTLVVHRLDMATSGLIVFARGLEMQRELSRMFREREVGKRYVAVVVGGLKKPQTKSAPTLALMELLAIRLGCPTTPAESLVIPQRERELSCAVESEWMEINLPIVPDWPNRPLRKIDVEHGKPSLTRYRVLSHNADTTHVELEPVTGRTHQLRVHMAAIGHPILGDALYGNAASAPRLLLHACALSFAHPLRGELLNFVSKSPF